MLGCAIALTITVALFVYSPALALAIGAIGAVVLVAVDFLDKRFAKPRIRSRTEVAAILQEIVDGTYDEIAWNQFIRYRIQDAALDQIRLRCVALEHEYPAQVSERLLSEAGVDVLRSIITDLERAGG